MRQKECRVINGSEREESREINCCSRRKRQICIKDRLERHTIIISLHCKASIGDKQTCAPLLFRSCDFDNVRFQTEILESDFSRVLANAKPIDPNPITDIFVFFIRQTYLIIF